MTTRISVSWPMNDQWRVIVMWSAVDCRQWTFIYIYMLFMTRKGCLLNKMFVYTNVYWYKFSMCNSLYVHVYWYNVSMCHNLYIRYMYWFKIYMCNSCLHVLVKWTQSKLVWVNMCTSKSSLYMYMHWYKVNMLVHVLVWKLHM